MPEDKYQDTAVREFEIAGVKYRYDMELVTVEQAQCAAEVLFYKRDTLDKPASHVSQMIKSGAGDYTLRAFAFILSRITEQDPVPFSDIEYERTLAAVRTMSVRFRADVEACLKDFFTRIGMESIVVTLLSRADEVRVDLQDLISKLSLAIASSTAERNTLPDSPASDG
jgi:hypothetical protein